MDQVKLNFRGRRDTNTRDFFKESRYMTQTFPEIYTPEKPYNSRDRPVNLESLAGPKHIYKLMGSLYEARRCDSPVKTETSKASSYETQVLERSDSSAKKVRSASAKADKTHRKMQSTIEECVAVQATYTNRLKQLN